MADVFRTHGEAYRQSHQELTLDQLAVMRAIEVCRTAQLGGHVDVCLDCTADLLPLAKWDRRLVFDLLFRAAADTLLTLGRDPTRLDAQLGITAVLHTWTRDLQFHPHLHCIVTGGGLSADGSTWSPTSGKFLFPIKVISKLFRGKFLDALSAVHSRPDGPSFPPALVGDAPFKAFRAQLYRRSWNVHAKRPFAGPEQVFGYLGRYTHRVGISNHRILQADEERVEIATRDGSSASMEPDEFIRRFLQHVLPRGFVKIRHDGLNASGNVNTRLEAARLLLGGRPPLHEESASSTDDSWEDLLLRLTGLDSRQCRGCGSRRLHREPLPLPQPVQRRSRAPPSRPPK